jgi:hypothetical protein
VQRSATLDRTLVAGAGQRFESARRLFVFLLFAGKTWSNSKALSSYQDRFTATQLTVGALRSAGGVVINFSAHHVVALTETFGVYSSYLCDRGRKPLIINQEAIDILRARRLVAEDTKTGILCGSR